MGPNINTDALNIQTAGLLQQVLHQLDQPPESMDTEWVDEQVASLPKDYASSRQAYEHTMRQVRLKWQAGRARAARKRHARRAAAIAASLALVAVTTFGAANAFQWKSFLRMFSPENGSFSFQTSKNVTGSDSFSTNGGKEIPPPPPDDAPDDLLEEEITLRSAEDLLALSTPGDQAFRPLLERYSFHKGNLYRNNFNSNLTFSLKDGDGKNCYVQIVAFEESMIDDAAASFTFEVVDGIQKTVRIGDDAVVVCANSYITAVNWIMKLGFCYIHGDVGEEALLDIAKILIDAGLKPV